MPKPVLGRGLGTLLGKAEQSESAAPPPRATVTPGVRSLMRGSQPAPAATPGSSIPPWYFYAGDILLVGTALLTIWGSPHPLSVGRMIFCGGLIVLAGVLGAAAIVKSRAGAGVVTDAKAPEQLRNHKTGPGHSDQQ